MAVEMTLGLRTLHYDLSPDGGSMALIFDVQQTCVCETICPELYMQQFNEDNKNALSHILC